MYIVKEHRELFKELKDSPFLVPKRVWRFGRITRGTPFFYPRRYNKKTKKWKNKWWYGFDVISLGWKTKWDNFRFEWCPGWSLVLFGMQLTVTYALDVKDSLVDSCMWEAYLNWKYPNLIKYTGDGDPEKRFRELLVNYGCTWMASDNTSIDYYEKILNKYWLEYYKLVK